MTGYAIVDNEGYRSKTIIGALMNYSKDVRNLKLEVPLSFQTYNWMVEPAETLESMYLQMAKDIRANTKGRIILGYTGGTDSATIAYYFAKAGIYIEYLHFSQPLKKSLFDSDLHIDKKIKELEELHIRFNLPKPVIHIETAAYYDTKYNESVLTKNNFHDNTDFVHLNRNYLGTSSEMFKNIESFTDQTVVVGLEKPKLHVDDYGIYWQMESEMYVIMMGERAYNRIAFFADKSAPHIFAKQAHEVLKYVLRGNAPKAEIQSRLHLLQHEASYYYTWCKLMGRITDEKRTLLTFLTKPNVQLPYGFGYNDQKVYENFVKNRLRTFENKEYTPYKNVVQQMLQLPTVNPLSDKFYVHRFAA